MDICASRPQPATRNPQPVHEGVLLWESRVQGATARRMAHPRSRGAGRARHSVQLQHASRKGCQESFVQGARKAQPQPAQRKDSGEALCVSDATCSRNPQLATEVTSVAGCGLRVAGCERLAQRSWEQGERA